MDPNAANPQGQNPAPMGDTGMGGGAPAVTPTPTEPTTPTAPAPEPTAPATPEPQAPEVPAETPGTDTSGGVTPPPAMPAA